MKRPEQHQIDSAAKKQFESTIPDEWAIRNMQETDYGIDYEIEVFENSSSTGVIFKIQLKGTTAISIIDSGQYVSFPFKIESLNYYLKEIQIPLFIIIADIKSKITYWYNPLLDNQLIKRLNDAIGSNQKTLNISINTKNQLPTDCNKLIYEYAKSQNFLSARYLTQSKSYEFSKIVNILQIDGENIKSLQTKVDIVKLTKIQYLLNNFKFTEAQSYINSILNSNESNVETKFQALLYKENIEFKSIDLSNPEIDAYGNISMKYAFKMRTISKKGPAYLKLFSLSLVKTAKLWIFTRNEVSTYMNWMANINDNDFIWKSSLVAQRLFYIKKIEILYSQIKKLINLAFDKKYFNIIPKITIRLLTSMSIFLARLDEEKIQTAVSYFYSDLFKISQISCKISEYYNFFEDFQTICFKLLTIINKNHKKEFEKNISDINKIISEIKDEKTRESVNKNFLADVNRIENNAKKYSDRELTIEDEIKAYKLMASGLGIDLSNDNDNIANIINIGINDLNPERILKNCKYLFVELMDSGLPAQWLKLPTAGFKSLICTKHIYAIEALSLDLLYNFFYNEYCKNCKDCSPHPQDWKWSRKWQREQHKLYMSLNKNR